MNATVRSTSFLTAVARQSSSNLRLFSSAASLVDNSSMPSTGPATAKFLTVMEDYRQKNFGQTFFTNYIREIGRTMDTNGDGLICQKELTALLRNIGAEEQLSPNDVSAVLSELGDSKGEIHVDIVEDMILGRRL